MDPRVFLESLESLPDPLPIPVLERPFDVTIRPPGSKSLTNRALLLAALAEGESVLHGALTDAEDARVMIRALEQLGARVNVIGEEVRVMGVGGRWRVPPSGVTLNLENAGTATRFLTAAAILTAPGSGPVTIDGNARMRERPIGELVELLRALGAGVEYAGHDGFPPVRVLPRPASASLAPEVEVGATASSQFISALMMAAVFLPRGVRIRFLSEPTSRSYVDMTAGLLRELGAHAECDAERRTVRVRPTGLYRFDFEVEPDASGATYFWAAAALSRGSGCAVPVSGERSLQGDAAFAEVLERMGARVERTDGETRVIGGSELDSMIFDLSLMPDAAMTLATLCCFAPGRSVICGLRTLRVKETDRLAALEAELRKVGVGATARPWTAHTPTASFDDEALCIVTPEGGIDCSPNVPRVEFDTYRDHRMAMALALIGLRRPNVFIRDPACVAKTYPTYWRDFARLYGVGA